MSSTSNDPSSAPFATDVDASRDADNDTRESQTLLPVLRDFNFTGTFGDEDIEEPSECETYQNYCHKTIITWLISNSDTITNYISPLIWTMLGVTFLDKESLLKFIYLPLIGFIASIVADALPVGGGVIYIPALYVLNYDVRLAVSFTIATTLFSDGLFRFLWWLERDEKMIIWKAIPFTTIPSWLGRVVALTVLPAVGSHFVKRLDAVLCVYLVVFVLAAIRNGGMSHALTALLDTISGIQQSVVNAPARAKPLPSTDFPAVVKFNCATLSIVSFLSGMLFVPYIGIGSALITYIELEANGYKSERSMATGIIIGGWVCIVPALAHFIHWKDFPLQMWLMVLPGVFAGTKVCTGNYIILTLIRCHS
jgi:uncharacterized membrane protein YfcA